MPRLMVLVVLAAILGQLEAAPVPKNGLKPPWKFPTQVGTEWVYDYSGKRDSVVTEIITKIEEKGGARVIHMRYTRDESEGQVINARALWFDESGLFDTLGKLNPEPEFFLLKLSYVVGDVWERRHTNLAFDRTVSQVVSEEKIKVPAGTFECVRVETKAYDGKNVEWTENNWYASGVGLVKSTGGATEKNVQVLKKFTLGEDVKVERFLSPPPRPKTSP